MAEEQMIIEKQAEMRRLAAYDSAYGRAPRATPMFSDQLRARLSKALSPSFDLSPLLPKVEERMLSAVDEGQTRVIISGSWLPPAAKMKDLCKAMQRLHPDIRFTFMDMPDFGRGGVLMFELE